MGVVLLAVLGVGSYALFAGDDGDGSKSPAAAAPREPGAPRGQTPSAPPRQRGEGGGDGEGEGQGGTVRSGSVPDLVNGLRIPVPKGWEGQSVSTGASVNAGSYACPVPDPAAGDEDSCVHGGIQSVPAAALGLSAKTPEEIAKADIAKNAEDSYGGGAYGEITSHRVDAAKAVKVAGAEGYLVRWKVVTSKGPDGYAETVAFPSPTTKQLVVLRAGLDIADDAPKLSVLDELLAGIEAGRAGAPGGGTGQNA
ncbi:membrane protein [Streptomyces sp. SPB074]|nr:membrane protein [Streptomyces sp. SPB074]